MDDVKASGSWNNFVTSDTGQTLLRLLASIGTFGQYGIERAQQEVFTDTLRVRTSMIRINRMLGVHTQRRRSGMMDVSIVRTDATASLTIPAYTRWVSGSFSFFNRSPVSFGRGVANLTTTVFNGLVTLTDVISDGTEYQKFVVGNVDNSTGDEDVWAIVAGELWVSNRTGLFRENGRSKEFWERTLPDGRVDVLFGNGIYGALLPVGAFQIGWVDVAPAIESSTPLAIGSIVNVPDFPALTVSTASVNSPNEEPPGTDFYKAMSSKIFSARERAVTRDDHAATAVEYNGVVDAVFRGQKEMNPADLRYSNIIGATLLTTTPWTDTQFKTFAQYMQNNRAMATCVVTRSEPKPVPLIVTLNIYAFQRAALDDVKTKAIDAVHKIFAKQRGSLGGLYHVSDIDIFVMSFVSDKAGSLIDYMDIITPRESISLPKTSYADLQDVVVNVYYTDRDANSTAIGRSTGL